MRLISLQTVLALNLTDSKIGMAVRMKKDRPKKNVAKSTDLFGGSSKSMSTAEKDGRLHCMIPLVACVRKGEPLPTSVQNHGVKMSCTNNKCQFAKQFVHTDCFKQLENTLIKIISNLGSARGWTDIQRRNNLWEKKGLTLIQKNLRCHCGLGLMTRDADFYKKMSENGTATPAEIKGKKKKKKELPKLNYGNNGVVSPAENVEILKKKFNDSDSYYPDDSFDDCNMSGASTDLSSVCWQKSNGLLFETPKRSMTLMKSTMSTQSKHSLLGNNSTQLPTAKSIIPVWKTVPSAAPAVITIPRKKTVTPPQAATQTNEQYIAVKNDSESSPEISLPVLRDSTSSLPLASWTSIVQSSPAPATVEAPHLATFDTNLDERKHQQREYMASITGSARNILVYTLFGSNAPSFLLGERIMADFYLPKKSFC